MSKNGTVVPQTVAELSFLTLGRWRLTPAGADPDAAQFGPSKPLALLVYLALSPGRRASREHLLDLLWADRDPDAGANALRQTVWAIRRRLGEATLATDNGHLVLAAPATVDRDEFLAAVQAQDHSRALELYHGEFLPGFATPGGAEFEKWADLERDRLRRQFVGAAQTVARHHLSEGRAREGVRVARRARDADPDVEASWRVLLECLVAAGDTIGAATEADALEQRLQTDDRIAEPATIAALKTARREGAGVTPAATHLVAELVGRAAEFSTIVAGWEYVRTRGTGRHVHVVAPAGFGKTRLLSDLHARFRAAGGRALTLRANPGERTLAFSLASELAARLVDLPGARAVDPGTAQVLVRLNPRLSGQFPHLNLGTPAVTDVALHRSLALAELIAAVAEEAPLALLLDDVHWADDASRQVLTSLLERTAALPVLLVTASRPRPEAQWSRTDTQALALRALDEGQVRELLTSLGTLAGEPWTEGLIAGLLRATHGSPLLLLETLQLAIDQYALRRGDDGRWVCDDTAALASLLSAGGALHRRLAELNRNQRWILLLLALDGVAVPGSVIHLAGGRSGDAVESDLHVLEQRGLIARTTEGWTVAHDEIGTQAIEAAPPAAITAAHEALGSAWTAETSTTAVVRASTHLLEIGAVGRVAQLVARYVRVQRREGDRRRASIIARELLERVVAGPRQHEVMQALPLWLRLGLDRPMFRVAVAVLMLSLGAGALWSAVARSRVEPPDAVVIIEMRMPDGRLRTSPIELRGRDWAAGQPIVVPRGAPSRVTWTYQPLRLSPTGERWLLYRPVGSTPGVDLFVVDRAGIERRVTSDSGDENGLDWTADGRRIVASVGAGGVDTQYELALIDPSSGRRDTLTRNNIQEIVATVSPEGSRLAYARRYLVGPRRPDEVCVTPLAVNLPDCVALPGSSTVGSVHWVGADSLIVMLVRDSNRSIVGYDITSRSWGAPITNVITLFASGDGRWLLLQSELSHRESNWTLMPIGRPSDGRQLTLPEGAIIVSVNWRTPARSTVRRIHLSPVVGRMASGRTVQLEVSGSDQFGNTVEVPGAVWWSSDPGVLLVDSATGRARARAVGTASVHVRVALDLEDSIRVRVADVTHEPVIDEDWGPGAERRWRFFGAPRPMLVAKQQGRALWYDGRDGSFTSGVYSMPVDAADGLGIEAWWSTALTARVGQHANLQLIGTTDEAALATWDHTSGTYPHQLQSRSDACSMSLPSVGAATDAFTVHAGNGVITYPATRSHLSGTWYRVRLQIMPDGRCGIAIDGRVVGLTQSRVATNRTYRVVLDGSSAGTQLLVGRVQVWRGVRDDVDWSLIEPTASTSRAAGRSQ